jgi:Fe2+ or Zn2+ uptake regulation protein
VYFPLVEEIQEKEKLQAQAPTPQRKIIIDLLQEQLKKTKRGEAAAQAKQAQERIDWLTSVKQSIPPPTPTK